MASKQVRRPASTPQKNRRHSTGRGFPASTDTTNRNPSENGMPEYEEAHHLVFSPETQLKNSNDYVKEQQISCVGVITEIRPAGLYITELDDGSVIKTHLSGKMRQKKIRIMIGDVVNVTMSMYDIDRGTIVYRHPKATIDREAPRWAPGG